MSRGTWGRFPVPAVSNSSPGCSGLCLMACGVDKPSQVTRDRVPGPAGSISSSGRFGLGYIGRGVDNLSQVTQARVPGNAGSTSSPGLLRLGSEGPRCRLYLPGDSDSGPKACRARVTRARVQAPAASTICPGRLGPWSECSQGPPAFPSATGHCPRARGFAQLCWATPARIPGTAVSIS